MKPFIYILIFAALLFNVAGKTQSSKINFVSPVIPGSTADTRGYMTGIAQDKNGCMWFSTPTGVIKYDGYTAVNYKHDALNPASLSSNRSECVMVDSSGDIWVGSLDSGLDHLNINTGVFTHYKHNIADKNSLCQDSVTALMQDNKGYIWVGTLHGVDRLDEKTGVFTHYQHKDNDLSSLSNNHVRALYQDREGTIWIGTGTPFFGSDKGVVNGEGGLNRFNSGNGTFTRYMHDSLNANTLFDNRIRAMFEDSRGNFWVGSANNGLHIMNRRTGTFTRYMYNPAHPDALSAPAVNKIVSYCDDHITFITEDAAGGIWIGSFTGGVNRYDTATKKIQHFKNGVAGFTDDGIFSGYVSKDGLVWTGTFNGNLYYSDPLHVEIPHYIVKDAPFVHNFCQDMQGDLWLATSNGLKLYDSAGKERQTYRHDKANSKSISSSYVWMVQKDTDGKIWAATNGAGIDVFDRKTGGFTSFMHNKANPNSLINDTVYCVFPQHGRWVWAGTQNGLSRMDVKTGKFTQYTHNAANRSSISNNYIECLLPVDKELIVGNTGAGGINILDEATDTFAHFLNGRSVLCLNKDHAGSIWAGTDSGLYYSNYRSRQFNYFQNLGFSETSIVVAQILEDMQNNLWIATNVGLFELNPGRQMVAVYTNKEGFYGDSLTISLNYKNLNGGIFFGTGGGYYSFNTNILKPRPSYTRMQLSNFLLYGKPVNPSANGPFSQPIQTTQQIILHHYENIFSFHFALMDYRDVESSKYFFTLENYETIWHRSGKDREALYFNVPPGRYIFHVKGIGSNGLWAEKKIAVVIMPPWWQTWWAITLGIVTAALLLWLIVYVRSRQLVKEKKLLEEKVRQRTAQVLEQKEEIASQRDSLEKTLEELQSTQTQLVQKEKMASLGELTAGIAHEIQNPLNFVNNFSEVNREMLEELKAERLKPAGERDAQLEEELLNDVIDNEQKINHHGRRADAIVKNMLQHSRKTTGQKELANINNLADEYLRLSYHGLRAKDKTFNAEMVTHFDNSLPLINIVAQDVGRVLLNLYNNAFYAVHEKADTYKEEPDTLGKAEVTYKPTVWVSTKRNYSPLGDGSIIITVADNGNGIPENIKEKIFQPFFTTKPTGQGTGLGLSLSYDIIKAHGGQVNVKTNTGKGTEFIITLPV